MDAQPEQSVNLYGTSYGGFAESVYAEVRREAYGDEVGQASWLTREELARFGSDLRLGESSRLSRRVPATRAFELRWCSSARSITTSSAGSSTGLVRNCSAPSLIARTARSIEPCAVRTMTGADGSSARKSGSQKAVLCPP